MLTSHDMFRLSQSLPTANQIAFEKILPRVNVQIAAAAKLGATHCMVDIPPILDCSPAFEYEAVCSKVNETLLKGGFAVHQQDIGLFKVHWTETKERDQKEEMEVKIVYGAFKGRNSARKR